MGYMELEYRKIQKDSPGLEKPQRLFETAFPPEERPSWDVLLSFGKSDIYAIYLEGKFVAFADVVRYQDLVYLFFLAVEDAYRNQGIGSVVLSDLKAKYPDKRLFLLADDPEPKYPDYDVRLKRIAFYERNGFHLTDIKVREMGVMYRILVSGAPVSKEEFLDTMRHLIGEEWFNLYYRAC